MSKTLNLTEARKLKHEGKTYSHIASLYGVSVSHLQKKFMKDAVGDISVKACAGCGKTGVRLSRHHVCYQENRIILLCDKCHCAAHPKKYEGGEIELPDEIKNSSILAQMVYCWRTERCLSVRDAANKIGINYSALLRFENGEEISSPNLFRVFIWMLGKS